jgi:uncharacterized protein YbjT (DUF2867 family)
MRVVVTGAGGFIGRYLTRALLERGRLAGPDGQPAVISELVLVDRAPFDLPEGGRTKVTPMAGDLRDDGFVAEVMGERVDSLFHLAATLSIEAERDLETGWAINLQLPLRLLEACRRFAATPRFVYASSIAVVQARWMAAVLAGRIALPDRDTMMREVERHRAGVAARYVNAARYTLEVDFRDYVRDLIRDMQRQPAGVR